MSSYYDRVLEDFQTESSFDEGILDEGILDEGIYDEALPGRKRPVRIPGSLGKASNFGRNVGASSAVNGSYVTKAELKSSLNSISDQVNDLKKTGITLASSLKRLDDGYEKIVKVIAKKDKTQDNIMSNTTMMSLLSTIANKPTLNLDALKVQGEKVIVENEKDAIQVDLTKTLMFTMLPTLSASGGSSDNNMMTMMMMVLLLDKDKTKTSGSNDTLMLMLPMMMMMGNKK
jgi:hypothetical protein